MTADRTIRTAARRRLAAIRGEAAARTAGSAV
jgi:hypothetical protein